MQACVSESVKTCMKAIIVSKGQRNLDSLIQLVQDIQTDFDNNGGTETVAVANINSSAQVVLSGTEKGVNYASSVLETRGYAGIFLFLLIVS